MHKDQAITGSPAFLKGWLPYLLLSGAALLFYAHTLAFGLTWFDDNVLLLENRRVLADAGNLGRLFFTNVFMSESGLFYRPLLNVSFMLDTLAGGPQFAVFHLTNLLAHALCVSLLFVLLRRLGSGRTASFLLALLFLAHPALTQAVAWIPGRNDSLLFIFSVLSFLSFLKHLESGSRPAFAGCLLFFLAALLTKETAVVLPLAAAAYTALIAERKPSPRASAALTAGALAAIVLWLLARNTAIHCGDSLAPSVVLNVIRNTPALVVFLGKAVFPLYPEVWGTLAAANYAYGLAGAALICLAVVFAAGPDRRKAYFGLLWFVVFLLPSLAAAKGGAKTVFIAEYRLYLPLAGFLVFLSGLKWFAADYPRPGRTAAAAGAALLAFALVSFPHSFNFKDRVVFWERAVQENPSSPEARLNLGLAYYLGGSGAAAESQYLAALRLNVREPVVHNNLGLVYADRGETARAQKEFEKELELNPGYSIAAGNLRKISLRKRTAAPAGRR